MAILTTGRRPLSTSEAPTADGITVEDHIDPRMGRRIVASAIKLKGGRVICGVRHFDKIMRQNLPTLIDVAHEVLAGHEEGFVTNAYEFVNRNKAWQIAVMAGQINFDLWKGTWGCLFSEDLW